jgi:hypothetical protein
MRLLTSILAWQIWYMRPTRALRHRYVSSLCQLSWTAPRPSGSLLPRSSLSRNGELGRIAASLTKLAEQRFSCYEPAPNRRGDFLDSL